MGNTNSAWFCSVLFLNSKSVHQEFTFGSYLSPCSYFCLSSAVTSPPTPSGLSQSTPPSQICQKRKGILADAETYCLKCFRKFSIINYLQFLSPMNKMLLYPTVSVSIFVNFLDIFWTDFNLTSSKREMWLRTFQPRITKIRMTSSNRG